MEEDSKNEQSNEHKFIGIWFECCHTYGRLYKNKEGTLYRGRCPKCLRPIQVPINAESSKATDRRFFRGG